MKPVMKVLSTKSMRHHSDRQVTIRLRSGGLCRLEEHNKLKNNVHEGVLVLGVLAVLVGLVWAAI
jgi:hypothetical protein